MRGIPTVLMSPLRHALLDCSEFLSYKQLYALFAEEPLKPWQSRLCYADNPHALVNSTISDLAEQRRTSGENALGLLLRVLGEQYPSENELHGRLLALAGRLEEYKQCQPKPETAVLEANPEKIQMLWSADYEKMLTCARAVARIEVPCYQKHTKQEGRSNSGTAWLIAPGLALTCWHVIENREGMYAAPLDAEDLQLQWQNTLLTFDYLTAGRGLPYGVKELEYPGTENHSLDYAIIRLEDRPGAPVRERGYVQIDLEAPLKTQTSLYIIQHPFGQPQQSAGGTFERFSPHEGRILYKTPTEPGTSGAPVFNRTNWRVVALHNGESDQQLREGTLMKIVLEDLKHQKPALYDEIVIAQG